MEYSVTDLNSQRFIEISAEQWQKNCNEKQILLRYLAIPLQETEEQLWLGIDDMQNLNACEIFAFIYHKQIEPVLISSDELKFYSMPFRLSRVVGRVRFMRRIRRIHWLIRNKWIETIRLSKF